MLEKVKIMLGIPTADETLLNEIIHTAETRLKIKLGGLSAIPDELSYIAVEVAVIRYNRITAEGAKSQNTDGSSTTYLEDDFLPFEGDISAWKNNQNGGKAGKVRFL